MALMSGGEAMVESLVREGVEVVFGIGGIHMSGILVALHDEPAIRLITTRHEQGAACMADGYARVSGNPGVALVVPGVGLFNAGAGLSTAYARSSPVLVIAGQVPRAAIGKNLGAIHEVFDQGGIVRNVTKWQRQVLSPREVPGAVTEAFRQMRTGRPRPVLIDMPPDVQRAWNETTCSCATPLRSRGSSRVPISSAKSPRSSLRPASPSSTLAVALPAQAGKRR